MDLEKELAWAKHELEIVRARCTIAWGDAFVVEDARQTLQH